MGGRPGEVSTRWVARKLGRNHKTVQRWCAAGAIGARAELGRRRSDGTRVVIRYWVSRDDVLSMLEE